MVSAARNDSTNGTRTGNSRIGVCLRARALHADGECKFRIGERRLREVANGEGSTCDATHKPTIGPAGTSAPGGAMAMGAGNAAGAGVGLLYQQHQITRTVGHPFVSLIVPPGIPRLPRQPLSQSNREPVLSNLPDLVILPFPPV